jgi:peptidoglycan/xylan/chitin deacetylase (PgdA/CDA1 family)
MSKSRVRSWLAAPVLLDAWRALPGTHLSVFTLHRFAVPDLGVPGHDPGQLADTLEQLRRNRIAILPLGTVIEAVRHQTPLPRRAVVFTIDDGYFDLAEVGAPIFQRYDCPVTAFVVTGFLDGACWLWWDKLSYLLAHSKAPHLAGDISHRCTSIPHSELLRLIDYLSAKLSVKLPEVPPEAFRPMSWSSVEALTRRGVAFGPHTVTHPILTKVTGDHAAREISESWDRLREVLDAPLSVFSYPNGDYGKREIDLVRAAGLSAAVATTPHYFTVDAAAAADPLYRIPRFAYPDQTQALLLTAAGFRLVQPSASARKSPYKQSR